MGRRHQLLDGKEISPRPISRLFGLEDVTITPHDCRIPGVCWLATLPVGRVYSVCFIVGCLALDDYCRPWSEELSVQWQPPTKDTAEI